LRGDCSRCLLDCCEDTIPAKFKPANLGKPLQRHNQLSRWAANRLTQFHTCKKVLTLLCGRTPCKIQKALINIWQAFSEGADMILDRIDNALRYFALQEGFAQAFEFLQRSGRETHKKYIDIHFVLCPFLCG
jgi:hypothetical protein